MKLEIRYSNHPEDSKYYTTSELRKNYLVETVFIADEANLVYSHNDRVIAGGVMPVKGTISLLGDKQLGSETFLARRELGIINVGGAGKVTVDGTDYSVNKNDALYVGKGAVEITFHSENSEEPGKFYINSTPAHTTYPTVHIPKEKANKVNLGSNENSNKRTIFQYIHPSICTSCQLVMGMTVLDSCNTWNSMPAHTHDRRMEIYFYFNLEKDNKIFHMMGEPNETRHIIIGNEQAIISPSWSIHSGVGTGNYAFIWGMAGENQDFNDMDYIEMDNLR